MVGFDMSQNAARKAYEQAGLGPENAQVIELHDCFSANELITYEALGLARSARPANSSNEGATTYGGKWVVNPSGGLISQGPPARRDGPRAVRGAHLAAARPADKRQVAGAKVGDPAQHRARRCGGRGGVSQAAVVGRSIEWNEEGPEAVTSPGLRIRAPSRLPFLLFSRSGCVPMNPPGHAMRARRRGEPSGLRLELGCASRDGARRARARRGEPRALCPRAVGFEFVNFDDPQVLLAHPAALRRDLLRREPLPDLLRVLPARRAAAAARRLLGARRALFGFQNPVGYHLGNVLLNAANVALLFWFLARATRRFGCRSRIAGVFAVLPVHVEAVSWVMGRKDTLSAFFVLGGAARAVLRVGRARREPPPAALPRDAALHLPRAAREDRGVAVRRVARATPRLLARISTAARAGRRALGVLRTLRVAIPPVLPHAVADVVAIVAWYQARRRRVRRDRLARARAARSRASRDRRDLRAAGDRRLLGSLVWPAQLSVFYRWPHVEIRAQRPRRSSAAMAIALAIVAAVATAACAAAISPSISLAFLALLFPYLNVVYVDIWRADRYIYLASFCALAVPALLLAQLAARGTRAVRRRDRRGVRCLRARLRRADASPPGGLARRATSLWRTRRRSTSRRCSRSSRSRRRP